MATNCFEHIPRYLIGFSAVAVSLFMIVHKTPSALEIIAAIYLLLICVTDTLYAKIPNLCNLALLLAGSTYNLYLAGLTGLGHALLGTAVGLSLLLIPYLLGGIGGGDVKALAALGALLGPGGVFQMFLYVGLIGGLLAILHYLFQRNLLERITHAGRALIAFAGTSDPRCIRPQITERLRFPYAAAIAFGFFCYVNYGELISRVQALLS